MGIDNTDRFTKRVADYRRYRPAYPQALFDHLVSACALRPTAVVADIGSGTGILTRQLLTLAAAVFAVEPNRAMRTIAEEDLADDTRFRSLPGSAEESLLADGCIDLVCAAQAFHWFDRAAFRTECMRILRPEGQVALIWNERELLADPFAAGYEAILQRHAKQYRRANHRRLDEHAMHEFFGHGDYERFSCPNHQRLDFTGMLGRMRSSSYCPRKGTAEYAPMVHELEELHADHADEQGLVTLRYCCNCYTGRLRRGGSAIQASSAQISAL